MTTLQNYLKQFDALLDAPIYPWWPWSDTYRQRAKAVGYFGTGWPGPHNLQTEIHNYESLSGFWERWWRKPKDYKIKRMLFQHCVIKHYVERALANEGESQPILNILNLRVGHHFRFLGLPQSWYDLFYKMVTFCNQLLATKVAKEEKQPELPVADLAEKFIRCCGFLGLTNSSLEDTIFDFDNRLNEVGKIFRLDEGAITICLKYVPRELNSLMTKPFAVPYPASANWPLQAKYTAAQQKLHTLINDAKLVLAHWPKLAEALATCTLTHEQQQQLVQQGRKDLEELTAFDKKIYHIARKNNAPRLRDYVYCCGFLDLDFSGRHYSGAECFFILKILEQRAASLEPAEKAELMKVRRTLQRVFGKEPYAAAPIGEVNNDKKLSALFITSYIRGQNFENKLAPIPEEFTFAPDPCVKPPLLIRINRRKYWLARGWLGLTAKTTEEGLITHEEGLTKAEINKAFRKASLEIHPDKAVTLINQITKRDGNEKRIMKVRELINAKYTEAFKALQKQQEFLLNMISNGQESMYLDRSSLYKSSTCKDGMAELRKSIDISDIKEAYQRALSGRRRFVPQPAAERRCMPMPPHTTPLAPGVETALIAVGSTVPTLK